MKPGTAQVDLTVDEIAIVIASGNEARKGLEQIEIRRASGEEDLPKMENPTQVYAAYKQLDEVLNRALREMRIDSDKSHTAVELSADALAVAVQSSFNAQKSCLGLLQKYAKVGNMQKFDEGKGLFETLESALTKLQFAFQNMPKESNT